MDLPTAPVCCLFIIFCLDLIYCEDDSLPLGACTFNLAKKSLVDKLRPLLGYRFVLGKFEFTICKQFETPLPDLQKKDAGAVHYLPSTPAVLGLLTKASIYGGANWLMLTYGGGDAYTQPLCSQTSRQANLLISCKRTGPPRYTFLGQYTNSTVSSEPCFYFFQLEHPGMCQTLTGYDEQDGSKPLSAGSILVIIFLCVAGTYLIGGFIYQRFVAGATGVNQIPNFVFWQQCANLQVDGCEFVFRSKGEDFESYHPDYEGLSDNSLPSVTRDAGLIPG